MNNKRALLFTFFSVIPAYAHKQESHARSFLYTRPVFDQLSLYQSLWRDANYERCKTRNGFSFFTITQQSIALEKTTRYFLPPNRDQLAIVGDDNLPSAVQLRDVRAEWLQLPSNFNSTLSVSPVQKQRCVMMEFTQYISAFTKDPFFEGWYLRLAIPVVAVDNDLRLIIPELQRTQLTAALNNPLWQFAHFPATEQTRTRIAQICGILGSRYHTETVHLTWESFLTVPTGNIQSGKELFEPVAGNNRSVEIGGMISLQFLISKPESTLEASFFLDLQGTLFIRTAQFRTFDLREKPWSRFLLFNRDNTVFQDQNIPGVNIMTRRVKVWPFMMADFSTGWTFRYKRLSAEVGYNIWGHTQEKVKFSEPFSDNVGIAGSGPGLTASTSTIAQQEPNDEQFTAINDLDFDIHSGEAGSALNQKIHFTLGMRNEGKTSDILVSIGYFKDIPKKNGALSTWGTWFKIVVAL